MPRELKEPLGTEVWKSWIAEYGYDAKSLRLTFISGCSKLLAVKILRIIFSGNYNKQLISRGRCRN